MKEVQFRPAERCTCLYIFQDSLSYTRSVQDENQNREMNMSIRIPGVVLAIMFLSTLPTFARTFTDPVAYCKAVGTSDKPDSRYTGPKLPAWMATKLHLQPDQPKMVEWRCANGAVLACLYGA